MGNQFKTALLLAALTVFIILVGRMIGGRQGMIIAFFLAGGMNFFSYWYSDRMVLRMYRAREVNQSQVPELYAMVSRRSRNAAIRITRWWRSPKAC